MSITSIAYEVDRVIDAMKKAHTIGYREGMDAAISRMRMIADIIPATVTKAKLLDMVRLEADALHQHLQDMGGQE